MYSLPSQYDTNFFKPNNMSTCKKPKQNEFNQPGACIPEAEWLRLVPGLPEDSVAAAGRAAAPGIFLHTGTRYHGVHIP